MNITKVSILLLCVLMSGCAARTGRIYSVTENPATGKLVRTEYSEYWEDIQHTADGSIKIHTLITLGNERLPADYTPEQKIRSSQGEIPSVLEIYFTNNSTNTVNLEIMSMKEYALVHDIKPKQISLEPGKWTVTEPIIRVDTIYGKKDVPYEIILNIDGEAVSITGSIHRLTMNELRQ